MAKNKTYEYSELANRYTLSFEEAQAYFLIGEKRLRRIITENEDAPFILYVGNRHYIKRPLFEKYLADVKYL